MIFVSVFLAVLAIIFLWSGFRSGNTSMRDLGFVFTIAAIGTGVISYIALSIL
jgi:hypothetical protein